MAYVDFKDRFEALTLEVSYLLAEFTVEMFIKNCANKGSK